MYVRVNTKVNTSTLTLLHPYGSEHNSLKKNSKTYWLLTFHNPTKVIIVSDFFFILIDKPSNQTGNFLDSLSCFELETHVNVPDAHSLDFFISSSDCNLNHVSLSDRLSDHYLFIAEMDALSTNANTQKTQQFVKDKNK